MFLMEIVGTPEQDDTTEYVMKVRREQEKRRGEQEKETKRAAKERRRQELARRRRRDAALRDREWHARQQVQKERSRG